MVRWYGRHGIGALWILGGGGEAGEGEVVPGGVVDCFSFTSSVGGGCLFFLVLIEYEGHIHVSLASP